MKVLNSLSQLRLKKHPLAVVALLLELHFDLIKQNILVLRGLKGPLPELLLVLDLLVDLGIGVEHGGRFYSLISF